MSVRLGTSGTSPGLASQSTVRVIAHPESGRMGLAWRRRLGWILIGLSVLAYLRSLITGEMAVTAARSTSEAIGLAAGLLIFAIFGLILLWKNPKNPGAQN